MKTICAPKMIVLLFLAKLVFIYSLYRMVKYVFYQYKLYQCMKDLPGPKIGNPFFGHLGIFWQCFTRNRKDVSKNIYKYLSKYCDKYGKEHGLVRAWLGPFDPWIVVCDAKLAKQILSNPHFADKATFYRLAECFITGPGIFTSPARESRYDRKFYHHFFTKNYLQYYMSNMETRIEQLIDKVEQSIQSDNGYYQNVNVLVSNFVYDTVGDNLFSQTFSTIKSDSKEPKYVKAVQQLITCVEQAMLQPWRFQWANKVMLYLVNIFNYQLFSYTTSASKWIFQFYTSIYPIVSKRFQEIVSNDGANCHVEAVCLNGPSMIDCLITNVLFSQNIMNSPRLIRHKQSKLEAWMDLLYQINFFVVAGHDTSTSTMSWALYLMAHHKEAQEKAREEVDLFMDQLGSQKPNLSNLKQLTYLDCFIKETLRLYPVASYLGRRSGPTTYTITSGDQKLLIPPHTNIIIFVDYIHKQAITFPQPDQFLPERFQEQFHPESYPNQSLIAFSFGERACIGKQYALLQLKLLLLRLLHRYEIHPVDHLGLAVNEHHFIAKPPNFSVKFIKRT